MVRKIKLSVIADEFKLRIEGASDIEINGLNLCGRSTKYHSIMAYVTNKEYVDIIEGNTHIKCILLDPRDYEKYKIIQDKREISFLLSERPEEFFYKIHQWLISKSDFYKESTDTFREADCDIHPTAFIEDGTCLGKHVKVGANTIIKRGSIIGDNTIIGCNCVIGSEGFQIIYIDGKPRHISHVGGVKVGNNVYIGDNTVICNALFEGETLIGDNVQIDNLVHIAHNCCVGNGAVITAGCILCGSSIVEAGSWIGVNSSILNKVTIAENTVVGIGSVVTRSTNKNSLVYGSPAKENKSKGGS